MVQLRTFTFVNSLQPQLASYISATCRGYLPIPGQASIWIEIAPGMDINKVTDIAQKSTDVKPGVQVVERAFGILEIHADKQDVVVEAGRQVLSYLNLEEKDRVTPRILTSELITNVDPHQAMLINRTRKGNLLLPGQTLHILEVEPAGYVVIAANEAEKTSPVSLIDIQPIGAFGRLYLAGTESVVSEGVHAIEATLQAIQTAST